MTPERKKIHLQRLYQVAKADGVYTELEANFLERIANFLALADLEEEYQEVVNHNTHFSEVNSYALYHRVLIMAMVDNDFSEAEQTTCLQIGLKMGLHPQAVQDIITFVHKEKGHLNPSGIIKIFLKYQN